MHSRQNDRDTHVPLLLIPALFHGLNVFETRATAPEAFHECLARLVQLQETSTRCCTRSMRTTLRLEARPLLCDDCKLKRRPRGQLGYRYVKVCCTYGTFVIRGDMAKRRRMALVGDIVFVDTFGE